MDLYLVTAFKLGREMLVNFIVQSRSTPSFKNIRAVLVLQGLEWNDFEFGKVSRLEANMIGKKRKLKTFRIFADLEEKVFECKEVSGVW